MNNNGIPSDEDTMSKKGLVRTGAPKLPRTRVPNLCGIPLASPRMGLASPRDSESLRARSGKSTPKALALEGLSELQDLMAQDVSSLKSRMRQNAERRQKAREEQERARQQEQQQKELERQEKEDLRRQENLKSIEDGLRATLTSRRRRTCED